MGRCYAAQHQHIVGPDQRRGPLHYHHPDIIRLIGELFFFLVIPLLKGK